MSCTRDAQQLWLLHWTWKTQALGMVTRPPEEIFAFGPLYAHSLHSYSETAHYHLLREVITYSACVASWAPVGQVTLEPLSVLG